MQNEDLPHLFLPEKRSSIDSRIEDMVRKAIEQGFRCEIVDSFDSTQAEFYPLGLNVGTPTIKDPESIKAYLLDNILGSKESDYK
ncbi:MAG: hypothetical protein PHG05_01305 [Candidatus Nanoarchaeia archaeon]|nr:hypothetical protein [Candidatus Nanoarchaeia archaeon]